MARCQTPGHLHFVLIPTYLPGMPMKLLSYITGQELFGSLSITDENRLDRLIGALNLSDSTLILSHANVLLSLYNNMSDKEITEVGGHSIPNWFYVQLALSATFLSENVREVLNRPSYHFRPVFSRRQLLYSIKKVLRLGDLNGGKSPLSSKTDAHFLGRVLLNASNFLVPPDLEKQASETSPSNSGSNALVAQLLPNFELDNPPRFDRYISRSLEYIRIFGESRPTFADDLSLDAYFEKQTGLNLKTYLQLITAVYFHYLKFTLDPQSFVADPVQSNIDADIYFVNFKLSSDELRGFIQLTGKSVSDLKSEIDKGDLDGTHHHYDLTSFRRYPLLFLSENVFTCIDLGFLVEKVSLGLLRTIHNCLPEDLTNPQLKEKELSALLNSGWGRVIETYVSNIFSAFEFFRSDVCFKKGKGKPEQIDGVIFHGNDLVILETKGGTLSATAKYGGVEKLIEELDKKFGRRSKRGTGRDKGGITQLLEDIENLFNSDQSKIDALTEFNCPHDFLNARRIFPVLVVEERLLSLDLVQSRLTTWFEEELVKRSIRPGVDVEHLLILPIEFLESIEGPISRGELDPLEFIKQYSQAAKDKTLPFWEVDTLSAFERFAKNKGISDFRNDRMDKIWDDFIAEIMVRLS